MSQETTDRPESGMEFTAGNGAANPQSTQEEPQQDDMRFNTTPNQLTLLRMVFVPIVVGMLYVQDPGWDLAAALAFGVASLTDWLDGYVARRQKVETVYGKLLDPLADKFLVVSALIMLQELDRIPPVVVMLLICREMAITGLRALASAEGVIIAASSSAKWKTATQMVAIPFIMVKQGLWGIPTYMIGQVLLYISLGISLWSAQDYVVGFFRGAKEKRRKRKERQHARRMAKAAARKAKQSRN